MGRRLLSIILAVAVFVVLMVAVRFWWPSSPIDQPSLVEFASEAVPAWRGSASPPVLVLLSADPFLEPIPDDVGAVAEPLFKTGDPDDLASQVGFSISDPVLLPSQTVRMALRCGILSGLTWVYPLRADEESVDFEALRTWLLSQSLLSDQEKTTLQVAREGITGVVEGRPFRVSVLGGFKGEAGPVQLHVDLSFYQSLYRNEIKTPLYELMKSSVAHLLEHLPESRRVTVSTSTANGDVPMTLRFLGATLESVFADRAILQQELSKEWRRRRDMLYLVDFHQVDKMVQLAQSNVDALPDDASTHFDLYRAYWLQKNLPLAEAALARACQLDSGYVYEYRNLAVQALDIPDSAAAVKYLRQALRFDADNVFFKLDLARVLLDAGEGDGARALLRELEAQTWSKVYYPRMPDVLYALGSASLTPSLSPSEKQALVTRPNHGF